MREVVVDTETTGLNYKLGDRIVEIACLELINHIPTGKSIQFYCSTEKKMEEAVIKIHGLTNEFLKNHPTFKEQSKKFLDFIKSDMLIIHNAEFDLSFINNELNIIGQKPIKNSFIDTVSLARKKLNSRIANLDHLCRRFDIDLAPRKLHGALLDCRLLADVYLELMGGKQTSLKLSREIKANTNKKNNDMVNKVDIFKVKISDQEVKLHKNFVKNIKNAMWHKLDY